MNGGKDLDEVLLSADGFLLDFDGVLADSEPVFRWSWNKALAPWNHRVNKKDYWKYWSSLGEGLSGEIKRYELRGIDVEEAAYRQRTFYAEAVEKGLVKLFPGAAELVACLDEIASRGGPSWCIASNSPSEIVKTILLQGGISPGNVVGGGNLPGKPSPAIFLEAAGKLEILPEKSVVVEDSWKGIAAARAGGFTGILVLNRYNSSLEISSDYEVSSLTNLFEYIKKTFKV